MEVKQHCISYFFSYQKEIMWNSLIMCDLVIETVQRYIFGDSTVFPSFPDSETDKYLPTDLFYVVDVV